MSFLGQPADVTHQTYPFFFTVTPKREGKGVLSFYVGPPVLCWPSDASAIKMRSIGVSRRTHSLGVNGERNSKEQLANPGSPVKCVCV